MLGQAHVVRALSHALESGRLHHAWLFTGTRGVGKTTLARILAKCLNCERGVGPEPCGVCRACQDIDAGRFGDVLEVDAATNTKVDEMRELLDGSQYRPVSGRYKVYIIDEVHMLSRHAFNAMLKTLEEPPEHMKFILATTDPQKVPVTVLSRCLQFALKPMTVDQLVSHLQQILEAEGIGYELPALRLVARAAQGSVRDSLSLLDQAIAFGAGRIEERPVADLLGVGAPDAVLHLAQALAGRDGEALLVRLQSLIEEGHAADVLLQDFARLMQQVALAQLVPGRAAGGAAGSTASGASAESAPDGSGALADGTLQLAQAMAAGEVQLCYQIALAGRRDLVHAPDEAAGLTMSFLRMLTFLQSSGAAPGGTGGGRPPVEPSPDAPRPAPAAAAPRSAPISAAPRSAPISAAPRPVPLAAAPRPAATEGAPRLAPTEGRPRLAPTEGGPRSAPIEALPRPAPTAPAPEPAASATATAPAPLDGPPPGHPAAADAEDEAGPSSATAFLPLPDSAADWLALVDRLPPAGVALELARHGVWRGRTERRLRLGLAQAHQALLTSRERLQGLLGPLLGPIQLEVVLEALEAAQAPAGSAASRDDERRAARQRAAEQAIAQDPVVRGLLEHCEGRLVEGSVRPRDEAA